MTPAEKALWRLLRDRSLAHLKFRRQHPIGDYITDFYCHELKLVVEVDGDIHQLPERKAADADREADLKSLGFTVLRFTNQQVLASPRWVLRTILSAGSGHRWRR